MQVTLYSDDFTAWMLNPVDYQIEFDEIEEAQKMADDDLIKELLSTDDEGL